MFLTVLQFLLQAVNKFKNDTGIKSSNAPVWPRPSPMSLPKPAPVAPTKVTYGSSAKQEQKVLGNNYVVKVSFIYLDS